MKLRHRLFEHVLLMLSLAVLVFAAAAALAWLTQWAEARQLPAYLVQGMHLVGMVLFFLDACVVIAASSIFVTRLFRLLLKEEL